MQLVCSVQLYCMKFFTMPILVLISVKVSIPSISKCDKLSFIPHVLSRPTIHGLTISPLVLFPAQWLAYLGSVISTTLRAVLPLQTLSRSRFQ